MEGMDEHLVRVHIHLSGDPSPDDLSRYAELEDALGDAVQRTGVGSLDGNQVGAGEYQIWLYGAQADLLAQVVKRTLADKNLPAGSFLFLRHGGVNETSSPEETWPL